MDHERPIESFENWDCLLHGCCEKEVFIDGGVEGSDCFGGGKFFVITIVVCDFVEDSSLSIFSERGDCSVNGCQSISVCAEFEQFGDCTVYQLLWLELD